VRQVYVKGGSGMKTIFKSVLSTIILLSLTVPFSYAAGPTKAPTGSCKGFTTKTGSNEYFKVVLKSMDRGECKSRMRLIGDTRLYDAVYFDVEVQNIHKNMDVVAYDSVFRLVTDEKTHVDCCATGWKGAFDGNMGEMKSNLLEPGTKKTGAIGFPLKKTSKPAKLIFDPSLLDIPAEKIIFVLP
jgi:hypothetical protein